MEVAILNLGTARLTNCTLSANSSGAGGDGSGCYVGNGGWAVQVEVAAAC